MDTGEPFLSLIQPLSISSSCRLCVEVSNLLCFYVFFSIFVIGILISLVKAPLAFVHYTFGILGLILRR